MENTLIYITIASIFHDNCLLHGTTWKASGTILCFMMNPLIPHNVLYTCDMCEVFIMWCFRNLSILIILWKIFAPDFISFSYVLTSQKDYIQIHIFILHILWLHMEIFSAPSMLEPSTTRFYSCMLTTRSSWTHNKFLLNF